MLLLNTAGGPPQHATDLYRMAGAAANLSYAEESDASATARYAAYAWLARHLQQRPELTGFTPSSEPIAPVAVELQTSGESRSAQRMEVSEHLLSRLFGTSLEEGRSTHALNCHPGPHMYAVGNKKVNLYPQKGIEIPATVLRPGLSGCDASRGTLIAVADNGRSELVNDEIVQEANRRGWIVWMIDPRGIGELAIRQEAFVSVVSLLLGEHFPWRQATDILRILRHIGGPGSRYPTAIYARGKAVGLAVSYVAATAERRELEWTVVRDGPTSFRNIAGLPQWVYPFGALRFFDISDLWRTSKSNVHLIGSSEEFIRREW
jgi:hypothetical protein